jgi:septal ring factor EnvC (AmiA/AmiB activator)
VFSFCWPFSLSLAGRCALAQDAAPPRTPAPNHRRRHRRPTSADERYKRMAADIEALQMDNESLKAKIASLEQKIDDLRQQLAAAANNTGVQEDLKRLAEKIAQVDKKREEDKQAISEEIRKSIAGLEKTLAGAPRPSMRHRPNCNWTPRRPDRNGFSYTIQEATTFRPSSKRTTPISRARDGKRSP